MRTQQRYSLDFGSPVDVPDDSGPPPYIPSGEYIVCIESVEERRGKVNNVQYLSWRFKVLDGNVHPDFRLYFLTLLEGRGIWKLALLIEAITGYNPGAGKYVLEPSEFLQRDCIAIVSQGQFNGSPINEIDMLRFREN